MNRIRSLLIPAACTIACGALTTVYAAKPGGGGGGGGGSSLKYSITLLGTLGGEWSTADRINNHGEVVGSTSLSNGAQRAFYWTAATGMIDLNSLVDPTSELALVGAAEINLSGQIAGSLDLPNGEVRACRVTLPPPGSGQFAVVEVLGTLGGSFSTAYGINARGDVIGTSTDSSGRHFNFLYTDEGGMTSIPGIERGLRITDFGQIGGHYNGRAVRYTPGVGVQDLGYIKTSRGGSLAGGTDMNLSGQVVGYSTAGTYVVHAFRYTDGVGMIDLGTLGGNSSEAAGINSFGDVVGQSNLTKSGSTYHAFLYTDEFGMSDLTQMVVNLPTNGPTGTWGDGRSSLLRPYSINDYGEISGTADIRADRQAFVLFPVSD